MKKSERFSVMVRIEETNEREEARKYSEFRKAIQDKKTKLAELEQYLDEYKERFLSLTRFGAQAEQIKSCYAFIRQLNGAIAQTIPNGTRRVKANRFSEPGLRFQVSGSVS